MIRMRKIRLMSRHANIGPLRIQSTVDSCIHVHDTCNCKITVSVSFHSGSEPPLGSSIV